jgi:hypothetical protein
LYDLDFEEFRDKRGRRFAKSRLPNVQALYTDKNTENIRIFRKRREEKGMYKENLQMYSNWEMKQGEIYSRY